MSRLIITIAMESDEGKLLADVVHYVYGSPGPKTFPLQPPLASLCQHLTDMGFTIKEPAEIKIDPPPIWGPGTKYCWSCGKKGRNWPWKHRTYALDTCHLCGKRDLCATRMGEDCDNTTKRQARVDEMILQLSKAKSHAEARKIALEGYKGDS